MTPPLDPEKKSPLDLVFIQPWDGYVLVPFLDARTEPLPGPVGISRESDDDVAAVEEGADDLRADRAGGPGDGDPH